MFTHHPISYSTLVQFAWSRHGVKSAARFAQIILSLDQGASAVKHIVDGLNLERFVPQYQDRPGGGLRDILRLLEQVIKGDIVLDPHGTLLQPLLLQQQQQSSSSSTSSSSAMAILSNSMFIPTINLPNTLPSGPPIEERPLNSQDMNRENGSSSSSQPLPFEQQQQPLIAGMVPEELAALEFALDNLAGAEDEREEEDQEGQEVDPLNGLLFM